MCVYVYMHLYIYVCGSVCSYTFNIHIYPSMHTYIHTYMMCMYIYLACKTKDFLMKGYQTQ